MAYIGYPFVAVDERLKIDVWIKGIPIPGENSARYRMDFMGNGMRFDAHGQEGPEGWEIDHIYPAALGGSDALTNLQPLHWRENRRKGDNYPWPPLATPPTGGLLGPTVRGGIIGRKSLLGLLSD